MDNLPSEFNKNILTNVALVDENSLVYTYNDLDSEINAFKKNFNKKNSLVFLKASNSKYCIIAYLACLRFSMPVLILDLNIDEILLKNLIGIYNPNLLIKENQIDYINKNDIELDSNLCVMLSTSGSTGSPKLVKLSKKNIISNAHSIKDFLEINSTHKTITTLPFNYSYGLSIINSHFSVGAAIILNSHSVLKKEFWNKIKINKINSFAGVPHLYKILKKINFSNYEIDSILYLSQAGGKLDNQTIEYFLENSKVKNYKFIVMYGQTEATARISYLPYKNLEKKIGSIGIPIPGGDIKLVSSEKKIITEPYQEGELLYSGKNVMMGYANNLLDLLRGDELHGNLYTGDLAYFDADGYFYITGRIKRFIKIYGLRISLDEVENMLIEKNIECVAHGKDDMLHISTTNKEVGEKYLKNLLFTSYKIQAENISIIKLKTFKYLSNGKIDFSKLL